MQAAALAATAQMQKTEQRSASETYDKEQRTVMTAAMMMMIRRMNIHLYDIYHHISLKLQKPHLNLNILKGINIC